MVQTALDVCNLALARIGAETIDAIDETTPAGAYCAIEYPQCRDWCLGKYRWAFASKIAQLAPRAVTPQACPRPAAYDIPDDVVGAIHHMRTAADKRLGRSADALIINGYIAGPPAPTPLFIEYTGRIAESLWPVWYVELVKTVLAAGLAASVARNNTLAGALLQLAFGTPQEAMEGGLYQQARGEDARNAPPRTAFGAMLWDDGALVDARYGPGYGWGAWISIPFVGLPSSFGPPTFIDFPTGG